jgi:hypothetical protein
MTDLLRLFVQIALLRRGPQDLPASPVLLAVTALAYFAVSFIVYSALPDMPEPWRKHLIAEVLYTLVSLGVLLHIAGKSERYLQTATAVFGYLIVLSPLTICSGWLIQRFHDEPSLQLPVALIGLTLFVWMIAIGQQVLKAALEWSTLASVVLVISWILLGQFVILALFPVDPAPVATSAPTPAA